MATILSEPVTGACAWRGEDFQTDSSWIYQLSPTQISNLDTALSRLNASGCDVPGFTREDFQLPELTGLLEDITTDLEQGRGFALLKGLPIDHYPETDIRKIYFGIGLNLGKPVSQNPTGDMLGEVMKVGDPEDKNTRVYQTNAYLPYHTDPSDVVALLCLRKARSGGKSSLVSAAMAYNELLANYPQHLEFFYEPTYYAHMGGDKPKRTPLFSYHDNKLSCRYLRQYIELGNDIMGAPLSTAQRQALDDFDAITADASLRLDMMLEPGDIQFANNYATLHSRTAFDDHEEINLRRKMLRLWLKMPGARSLAPDFPGRNGFSDD